MLAWQKGTIAGNASFGLFYGKHCCFTSVMLMDTFGTTAGDMTSSASSASAAAFARGLRFAAAGAAAVLREDVVALLAAGFLPAGALQRQILITMGRLRARIPTPSCLRISVAIYAPCIFRSAAPHIKKGTGMTPSQPRAEQSMHGKAGTYFLAGAALGFFSGLKSSSLSLAISGSDADEGNDSSSTSSLSLSTIAFFFAAARFSLGAAFFGFDTSDAAGAPESTDRWSMRPAGTGQMLAIALKSRPVDGRVGGMRRRSVCCGRLHRI